METRKQTETIIYGGAFNPPTLAHSLILEACVDYARQRQAEVWLLPSGDRTDKTIPVPRETRLAYLAAMLSGVRTEGISTRVLTTELDREIPVETYDTAVELAEAFPDRQMIWVFGADSTETMGEWKEGAWLLEHLDKLVIERPGSVINPLARHAVALTVVTPDVSSTEVRRRLAGGEPVDGLVPRAVAELLAYASALTS